jgi:pentapeptide MXKDX repeat protein
MTKILFAAVVSAGLAYSPAAMAQATQMDKGMMKEDKMKMEKKGSMAKPAMKDDKMMDKKGSMSSDKMKK